MRYNNHRDGIAINTRINAGTIFQVVLISYPCINHLVCLFQISVIIMYSTAVIIISIIIGVWSWKKINCSMIGEA